MDVGQAGLFGVVQGLTEFLPISSSGHLAALQILFGLRDPEDNLFFVLLVHTASLLAVVCFFRRRIAEVIAGCVRELARPAAWTTAREPRLVLLVALSTLVTGLPGLMLEEMLEQLSASLLAVGTAFLGTGVILSLSRLAPARPAVESPVDIPWLHAVYLGLAQLLAVTPGISRSGTTIVAALLLGWSRPLAVEYSFFMAIPAILVPTAVKLKDVVSGQSDAALGTMPVIVSFVASAVTGFLALALLAWIVNRGQMHRFAYYVLPLGVLCILAALLGLVPAAA